MNRTQGRAPARLESRRQIPERRKHSHRVPPQRCALWVPEHCGYVAEFGASGFRVVEYAELARHYDEDEAASMAIAFREVTGLRVAVRPVYCARAVPA